MGDSREWTDTQPPRGQPDGAWGGDHRARWVDFQLACSTPAVAGRVRLKMDWLRWDYWSSTWETQCHKTTMWGWLLRLLLKNIYGDFGDGLWHWVFHTIRCYRFATAKVSATDSTFSRKTLARRTWILEQTFHDSKSHSSTSLFSHRQPAIIPHTCSVKHLQTAGIFA